MVRGRYFIKWPNESDLLKIVFVLFEHFFIIWYWTVHLGEDEASSFCHAVPTYDNHWAHLLVYRTQRCKRTWTVEGQAVEANGTVIVSSSVHGKSFYFYLDTYYYEGIRYVSWAIISFTICPRLRLPLLDFFHIGYYLYLSGIKDIRTER